MGEYEGVRSDDSFPVEAFELAGNEHRMAILDGLLELHRAGDNYPASFSQLREAASMEVSSQFSYHLDKLTGSYIKYTDDGYSFLTPGWNVATAVREGTYQRGHEFRDRSIPGQCSSCGRDALNASYQEEWVTIHCMACQEKLIRYPAPPGLFNGRTIPEFLQAFDRIVRTDIQLARNGICPACSGLMTCLTRIDAPNIGDSARAVFNCGRCGNRLSPGFGVVLLDETPVQQYCNRLDQEICSTLLWELNVCVEAEATVIQENPWQCEIVLSPPGGVVIRVDKTLTVTDSD